MTRFARAKGSKSSNEKKPEEATAWAELKNSMLSKNTIKTEDIKPKEEVKSNESKPTEWASLGDDLSTNSLLKRNLSEKKLDSKISKKDIKSKRKKEKIDDNSSNELNSDSKEFKVKKKKKKIISEEANLEKNEVKVKEKNKKRKFEGAEENSEVVSSAKKKKFKKSEKAVFKTEGNSEVVSSAKKKKLKKTEKAVSRTEEKPEQNFKNKKTKDAKNFHKVNKEMKAKYSRKEVKENNNYKKQFNEKFNKQSKDRKKFKNKEGNPGVEELIINGEKIPIVKFQGFYVTLEDAERLKKLRSEMIKEGIPKGKLEAAIKLERRRAEKALSRLKKSLCFHCRGHGHLLSNCPKLTENENTSTGICYKCGSTEHSAAECRVVKGASYQFAECFICKEQGHIARQCPDNPRGLYPQGGACRECGDVTHLRRDCPKIVAQKTEEAVTVGLRNDRNLECLDEEIATKEKQNMKNKVKKNSTIKF